MKGTVVTRGINHGLAKDILLINGVAPSIFILMFKFCRCPSSFSEIRFPSVPWLLSFARLLTYLFHSDLGAERSGNRSASLTGSSMNQKAQLKFGANVLFSFFRNKQETRNSCTLLRGRERMVFAWISAQSAFQF